MKKNTHGRIDRLMYPTWYRTTSMWIFQLIIIDRTLSNSALFFAMAHIDQIIYYILSHKIWYKLNTWAHVWILVILSTGFLIRTIRNTCMHQKIILPCSYLSVSLSCVCSFFFLIIIIQSGSLYIVFVYQIQVCIKLHFYSKKKPSLRRISFSLGQSLSTRPKWSYS